MNERIEKFALTCGAWHQVYADRNFMIDENFDIEKFAELIVAECMKLNKVETTARDLPEYNLGMLEGYRRARENMGIHFGIEQ